MSASKLVNMIKTINTNVSESQQGIAVMFGLVIDANPLQIKVDQRFIIDKDFLILTHRLQSKSLNLNHTHQYEDNDGANSINKNTEPPKANSSDLSNIEVSSALAVNDRVILLRIQGGQKYIVLDKVV